ARHVSHRGEHFHVPEPISCLFVHHGLPLYATELICSQLRRVIHHATSNRRPSSTRLVALDKSDLSSVPRSAGIPCASPAALARPQLPSGIILRTQSRPVR